MPVSHYHLDVWKDCVFKGVYLKKGEQVQTNCHTSDSDFQVLLHYDFFCPNASLDKNKKLVTIEVSDEKVG